MGSLVLDNGVSLQWEASGSREVRVNIRRPDGTGLNDVVSKTELKRLMKEEIKSWKSKLETKKTNTKKR